MAASGVLGKRRVIWLGLIGVVVPLAVMLALQYYWLVDLERTSGIARHATLQKFLQVIDKFMIVGREMVFPEIP